MTEEHHELPAEERLEYEQTELARLNHGLRAARQRVDKQAVNEHLQEIARIRKRIANLRAELAELASERAHMVDLLEQVQALVLRHQRAIADHDRRMERLRNEILRLGGNPGKWALIPIVKDIEERAEP